MEAILEISLFIQEISDSMEATLLISLIIAETLIFLLHLLHILIEDLTDDSLIIKESYEKSIKYIRCY